jgi:hypothetical protein
VILSFDPFWQWIFVARSSRTVRGWADGLWAHRGRSIKGVVLEVGERFSDS